MGGWLGVNSGYALCHITRPRVSHQLVSGNILTQLNNLTRNSPESCSDCHALMEVDWEVSSDTVVRPDILMLCDEIDEKIIGHLNLFLRCLLLQQQKEMNC